jgi:hypothetical protein
MLLETNGLPMLMGLNTNLDADLDTLLRDPDLTTEAGLRSLARLNKYLKIKATFSRAVPLLRNSGCETSHIINGMFVSGTKDLGQSNPYLCAMKQRKGSTGWHIPNCVIRYEPLIDTLIYFKSYEEFRKQFDTFFISEAFIKELWAGKSAQTGNKYCKVDFRSIGHEGRRILQRFLVHFKGIESLDGTGYANRKDETTGDYKYLHEKYYSYGSRSGRLKTIEHRLGSNRVYYSSEFAGCGNGSYGIVASRSKWLHLEDD